MNESGAILNHAIGAMVKAGWTTRGGSRWHPPQKGTAMPETSIVRENLMTVSGYSPCWGLDYRCSEGMPRTRFDGEQFVCPCGWRSEFPTEFIDRYKATWLVAARAAIESREKPKT